MNQEHEKRNFVPIEHADYIDVVLHYRRKPRRPIREPRTPASMRVPDPRLLALRRDGKLMKPLNQH